MSRMRQGRKAIKELRPEYEFDYAKARPNRFAAGLQENVVAVVLEADVAKVFDTSESVNRLLRSVIAATPKRGGGVPPRRPRRKVS